MDNTDFILIGSDGVFDRLENNEISTTVYEQAKKFTEGRIFTEKNF